MVLGPLGIEDSSLDVILAICREHPKPCEGFFQISLRLFDTVKFKILRMVGDKEVCLTIQAETLSSSSIISHTNHQHRRHIAPFASISIAGPKSGKAIMPVDADTFGRDPSSNLSFPDACLMASNFSFITG